MPLPLRSPTPQVIGFALLSGSCPAAAQKTPSPRPCHTNFVKLSSSCFQFLTPAPAAQGHRWLAQKSSGAKTFTQTLPRTLSDHPPIKPFFHFPIRVILVKQYSPESVCCARV